jgi:hypothetical protein
MALQQKPWPTLNILNEIAIRTRRFVMDADPFLLQYSSC